MRRWVMCAVLGLAASFLAGAGAVGATPADDPIPVDDCGDTLSKPDGAAWECTFADDFDGRRLDLTKWVPQKYHSAGTPPARACFVDDPRNISVADGNLRLTVRKTRFPIFCDGGFTSYTAGNVSTYLKFSQQYGRFEARIKVAKTDAPGLQEAFWLWPDVRVPSWTMWPAAGEIDIVETYSQHPDLAIPFLHYTWHNNFGPQPGLNTAWTCAAQRGVFNTYALTWTPTTLTIDVNGTTCLVNTSGDPAFQKPYIAAFTSALGVGGNALTADTPLPATMMVDYLRVWR